MKGELLLAICNSSDVEMNTSAREKFHSKAFCIFV